MQKLVLCFILATVCSAVAVPLAKEYSRYVEFHVGGEGNLHTIDLEAQPDMELLSEITRDPTNNLYLLFTRRNPSSSQTLVINDAASIISSNFNARVPTIVIAHGWLGNQDNDMNPLIRNAYLAKSDVNVIVLDWRRLALSDYVTAARGVPAVGRGLGQFLAYLNQLTGAPFNTMHIIGFSLGAHLVGNAGRELGGRPARITALDPAGPLWNNNIDRVNPNDGIYVEAIHTNGGTVGIGIGTAVADADFFPNGGNSQPSCLTSICDHNRAWELFAATVTHNHLVGRECASYLEMSSNACLGREFLMGNDDLNKFGTGMYRLDTGRSYPY